MACGKGRGLRLRRFLSLTAVSLFIAGFRKRLRAFVRSRAGSCTPDRATGVAALALLPGRRLRLVRVCHAGKEVSSRGCEGTPCERRAGADRSGPRPRRPGAKHRYGRERIQGKLYHPRGGFPSVSCAFLRNHKPRGVHIACADCVCGAQDAPRGDLMSRTAVHTMCRPSLSEFSLASPSSIAPNSGMYARSADHASLAKAPLPWKQALITLTGLQYSSELPAPRSLSPGKCRRPIRRLRETVMGGVWGRGGEWG